MRNRRALSTVVGMVFAIIALTTTVTYITFSMNTLSQYNQSVLQKNQQNLDVGKEKFQITGVTFINNKFSITAANTGNLPINFTKLWIQNMTSTDWYKGYTPTSNIVGPGQTVTLGQSFKDLSGFTIKSTPAYNLKLVTSRGNTQQFSVGSVGSAPLSIQFLAAPSSVSSGFKTELLMIVTNNGSSTLTNVTPQTPTLITTPAPTAACTLSQNQANPPSYNTLAPGGTAIFQWDMTATGTTTGQYCTWMAQLQGGVAKNNANATATLTQITLTSTVFAQNSGILTLNYTTFRWELGSGWNTGWSITANTAPGFTFNMTNNNATSGTNFYISKATQLYTLNTASGSVVTYPIANIVYSNNGTIKSYSCTGPPSNDYCQNAIPRGTITLYFGPGSSHLPTQVNTQVALNLLIFGKYATCQNCAGSLYGQNLSYLGILTS